MHGWNHSLEFSKKSTVQHNTACNSVDSKCHKFEHGRAGCMGPLPKLTVTLPLTLNYWKVKVDIWFKCKNLDSCDIRTALKLLSDVHTEKRLSELLPQPPPRQSDGTLSSLFLVHPEENTHGPEFSIWCAPVIQNGWAVSIFINLNSFWANSDWQSQLNLVQIETWTLHLVCFQTAVCWTFRF